MSNVHRVRFANHIFFVCANAAPRIVQFAAVASTLAALLLAPACLRRPKDKAIPIRITAGESVTLERAAAKGDDVFALTATGGQTLALEEDEYCPDCERDSAIVVGPRVFLADRTPPKDLPTPEGFGGCREWRWMKVLPTSGVYHIVVSRRSEKRYRLRVSLLNPDDPIFDPGITPDRISIGGGLFPPGSKLTRKEFEPSTYMDYCSPLPFEDGLPAHLRLQDKHHWLGVMSLEGLKRANPLWVGNGDLAELERATRPGAAPVKPPLSSFDDSVLMHWGRLEPLEGKSWRGLRWIAQYSQEEDELQNPLMYVFSAISNDGKFFIWLWVDIEDLDAPFQLVDKQKAQLINDQKAWEALQRKANAALAGASPKSFKPDLNQLDTAVHSLELR